jgi:hypothetical protein
VIYKHQNAYDLALESYTAGEHAKVVRRRGEV